jgi:hypothetical protein
MGSLRTGQITRHASIMYLRFPAMRTDTTSPYTAMIPAITTGTSDYIIQHEFKEAC